MVKRGFRGERKRILSPALSQGEGEIVTIKGEYGDGKSTENLPLYTYSSLADFLKEGEM